ncbi:transcription/translation regulatory transformer protein RfaH [Psychromonas hadalis]|uniref:transcription/translation regulatory transformer protein RfaH n=1 Tax=Psychromonas hadalis TaxID=211669 RepID=UPI0003B5A5FD|nr:transcription/translation regulatory transformer protein RfaH [Psychromonas hadalis]
MNKQWFIVYCKSREEERAFQNLHNQGIESFFPKIKKEKISRGKKIICEESLFPNYLFIHIGQEDINFNRIRSTRGINDFIRFGGKISTVPDTLMQQLKKICYVLNDLEVDKQSLFKNGDKIEIIKGAFKGATAIFSCDDGLARSMLLLNILNQDKSISFCNKEIKKI